MDLTTILSILPLPTVCHQAVEVLPLIHPRAGQALICVDVHQIPAIVGVDRLRIGPDLGSVGMELVCRVRTDPAVGLLPGRVSGLAALGGITCTSAISHSPPSIFFGNETIPHPCGNSQHYSQTVSGPVSFCGQPFGPGQFFFSQQAVQPPSVPTGPPITGNAVRFGFSITQPSSK